MIGFALTFIGLALLFAVPVAFLAYVVRKTFEACDPYD